MQIEIENVNKIFAGTSVFVGVVSENASGTRMSD